MRARRLGPFVAVVAAGTLAASLLSVPAASAKAAKSESPKAFLTHLAAAFRKGDTKFLFSRLNPAVIERYGRALCQGYMLTEKDTSAKFIVRHVGASEPFEYASDGQSTTVPRTRAVRVTRTRDGSKVDETIHIALDGRRQTWFTACHPTGAAAIEKALGPYTGTYTGMWKDTHFNVSGDMKLVATIDVDAHTLNVDLSFTGPLFGSSAPHTEHLPPLSLDVSQFGAPVAGMSTIFGPYTVTYDGTGKVSVVMPQCPPGSCRLEGTLKPGDFSGMVSVALSDGTTSQGTVSLTKEP